MSRSTSSDLAKGRKFTKQLLYVQHVDKEKDPTSRISERSFDEYFLGHGQIFSDPNLSELLKTPKANLGILESALQDKIINVQVYSNPLPAIPKSNFTIHAFVVFQTKNTSTNEETWWSLEKNGQYIVLQQSPVKEDVTEKLFVQEEKMCVKRLEPVKEKISAMGTLDILKNLLRVIMDTNQITSPYHLLMSNCQQFASFVFKKANCEGKKWSTWISAFVDLFGLRNTKTKSEVTAGPFLCDSNLVFREFDRVLYKAYATGKRNEEKNFRIEKFLNSLTSEYLNSVNSKGYTLLEWATVFFTSDWPIDQFLIETGAEIQTDDEGLFLRDGFSMARQYLPSKKSQFLSFNRIAIRGLNKTGQTALHWALYQKKWDVAKKILNKFPDYVNNNATNSLWHPPLHLAIQFNCKIALIKKILALSNSESVNKSNEFGENALLYAIENKDKTLVVELLNHKDLDVNLKDNDNQTALHFACWWKKIPINLFKKILEKSTNVVNAQNQYGDTALHWAIMLENRTAVEELLKHKDVDVNLKNNNKQTALIFAVKWKNTKNRPMPIDLFKVILGKSTHVVNAQDKGGNTALHYAIENKFITAVKELLNHQKVNLNVKNNNNQTALNLCSKWKDIPENLLKIINEKTTAAENNAEAENEAT